MDTRTNTLPTVQCMRKSTGSCLYSSGGMIRGVFVLSTQSMHSRSPMLVYAPWPASEGFSSGVCRRGQNFFSRVFEDDSDLPCHMIPSPDYSLIAVVCNFKVFVFGIDPAALEANPEEFEFSCVLVEECTKDIIQVKWHPFAPFHLCILTSSRLRYISWFFI